MHGRPTTPRTISLRSTRRALPPTLLLTGLLLASPTLAGLVPSPWGDAVPTWGAWRTDLLDTDSINPGGTAIALDAEGHPHITYAKDGTTSADASYYMHWNGLAWQTEKLSDPSQFPGDILIDAEGHVHTSQASWSDLYYSTNKNGAFTSIIVPTTDTSTNYAFRGSEIEQDSEGRIHIIYTKADDTIWHVYQTMNGWATEHVLSNAGGILGMGAALDSQDQPHVAGVEWDQPGENIYYTHRNPDGTWTTSILAGCDSEVSLDVDSQDRPHIVCHSSVNGLVYHHHDGTTWNRELIHHRGNDVHSLGSRYDHYLGRWPDITIDTNDQPHVSHHTLPTPWWWDNPAAGWDMMYSTKIDDQWRTERIDYAGTGTGGESSITTDAQGMPRIAYVYQRLTSGCGPTGNMCFDLKYAEPLPATADTLT